jgi:hypothetical protein
MSERKPKVFVSSTIYDFRDLRSALKLWLEEYGYDVLRSHKTIKYRIGIARDSEDGACYGDAG